MSERETPDFMSVDTFSELPFMRRDQKPPNPVPIRLFGFNFPPDPSTASDSNKRRSSTPTEAEDNTGSHSGSGAEAVRKFECNYCFRNFPTSQALGGHQNAHKRERQHAKRAHLAAAADCMLGYHRVSVPTPPHQLHYNAWSMPAGDGGVRFYGGLGSVVPPFNGSPMLGHWRDQAALNLHQRELFSAAPPRLPFLRGGEERKITSSATLQREWHGQESKDGVSLDLHL